VHQVGDKKRLYYDARSTNHQDLCKGLIYYEILKTEFNQIYIERPVRTAQ